MLGFLLVVWVSLLVIVVVAPEVYDQALRLPGGRGAELAFLAALALHRVARGRGGAALALDVLVDPGRLLVRRAPGAGGRIAAHRVLAVDTPVWYVLYQPLLGVAQFGIGLTTGGGREAPAPHPESLLVLYPATARRSRRLRRTSASTRSLPPTRTGPSTG